MPVNEEALVRGANHDYRMPHEFSGFQRISDLSPVRLRKQKTGITKILRNTRLFQ